MNKDTGMICNIVARMQVEIEALSGSIEELDALRDRVVELEAALQKIAQHDMQAIALDALRPGERIRGKTND
jgi:hypothetical protein